MHQTIYETRKHRTACKNAVYIQGRKWSGGISPGNRLITESANTYSDGVWTEASTEEKLQKKKTSMWKEINKWRDSVSVSSSGLILIRLLIGPEGGDGLEALLWGGELEGVERRFHASSSSFVEGSVQIVGAPSFNIINFTGKPHRFWMQ